MLLYATIAVWALSVEKMMRIFVVIFVSVATLRHHPRWASGVEKVLRIFVVLFVSVATLRHHPRLGVRRRESAF